MSDMQAHLQKEVTRLRQQLAQREGDIRRLSAMAGSMYFLIAHRNQFSQWLAEYLDELEIRPQYAERIRRVYFQLERDVAEQTGIDSAYVQAAYQHALQMLDRLADKDARYEQTG